MRIALVFALLGWSVTSAVAQTCVDDLTGRVHDCTANDVGIATLAGEST